RGRRTRMLLLTLPFLPECVFALGDIGAVAIRIDERVGPACLHLFVLRGQAKIGSVRAKKNVARQALKHRERLHVVFGDLWIFLVSYQNITRIYVRTADDHSVQLPSTLINLHGPGGAALGMSRREMGGQLRTP